MDPVEVLAKVAAEAVADWSRCGAARRWCEQVQSASAELRRRARVERRRDRCLQDEGAFEIKHWDEVLGWAVLIFNPHTFDGELPPPSFDEFEDRAHDRDYWIAADAALDAAGAPKESE
jgi:hypothetical protein